jgi:hypothetical protein
MTPHELFLSQAESSFGELSVAVQGVSQELSWSTIGVRDGEYLHTSGCILGIVQHVAVGKTMYASMAFMNCDVRWRDCIDDLERIGQSWEQTLEYLRATHDRWLRAWQCADLDRLVEANRTEPWPAWKLISMLSHHDSYHAGQIELAKVALAPATTPPESTEAADIRRYCQGSPCW